MVEEMDDIITSMRVSLERARVQGIPEYMEKLESNSQSGHFPDFFLEGRAALMFSKTGFSVTIQDSPDLALKFNNEQFYAEVTRFKVKEQDERDEVNMMSAPDDLLVLIGDTVSLEGKPAWEQVYDVAKKKIKQYKEHAPHILVIGSNSDCVDDTIMTTVVNMINEDVRSGKSLGFAKLNGILFISLDWYNISQRREVYFRRTSNPAVSLSRELVFLLDDIRLS